MESTVFFVVERDGRWTVGGKDSPMAVANSRDEATKLARQAARILRRSGGDVRVKVVDPEPRSFKPEED